MPTPILREIIGERAKRVQIREIVYAYK